MERSSLLRQEQVGLNVDNAKPVHIWRGAKVLGALGTLAVLVTLFALSGTPNGRNGNHAGDVSHVERNQLPSISRVNAEKNAKLRVNLEQIVFEEDLVALNGQRVQLVEDPGDLHMQVFTNSIMKGDFDLNEQAHTLSFVFDGIQNFVSLQLIDQKSEQVISSFYTAKTAQSSSRDFYSFDGKELDLDNEEEVKSTLGTFYSSELVTNAILLSVKVASLGYTGPMAQSIRMLHAMAMHWFDMPGAKDNINVADSLEANRLALNVFFLQRSEEFVVEEEEEQVSLNAQFCLFGWIGDCDDCPGGTDGCPSYCYTVGKCAIEDKCGNPCYGGCGEDCSCWSWVCGDCNCHCLCENHDYFCSCEGNDSYSCWGMWEWFDDECD